METLKFTVFETAIGPLALVQSEKGLVRVMFENEHRSRPVEGLMEKYPDTTLRESDGAGWPAVQQINEYFAGTRTGFDLDLDVRCTDFRRRVLTALQEIPFGETRSYGDIAERIGNPRASRAVGGANHANPIPIIIPCHRVIGSSGSLTGFGGGLDIKEKLLRWEKEVLDGKESGNHPAADFDWGSGADRKH